MLTPHNWGVNISKIWAKKERWNLYLFQITVQYFSWFILYFQFLPGTNTPNLARRRGILVKPDKFECKIEVKQKWN